LPLEEESAGAAYNVSFEEKKNNLKKNNSRTKEDKLLIELQGN
jgi:hypothetical protein